MPARLLTTSEVAKIVGLSATTIHRLRTEQDFPQPIRLRGMIRFHYDEVEKWLAERPRVNERASKTRRDRESAIA